MPDSESRRKVLEWLNGQYIYGRLPVLHTILLLIELIMTIGLVAKFNSFYASKPTLTTMVTNALLGGIADTVAQAIGAFQKRSIALPTQDPSSMISSGVELDDFNEKPAEDLLTPSSSISAPPSFDFERTLRFMSYGFLMAPIQLKWYGMLKNWFPITEKSATGPALQRVAMDQLIFAPIGLTCFFTYMTVTEGGGKHQVVQKFRDIYVPTLRANYVLWPAVQVLNFRVMPLQFQIPFVSTVGIAWTAYLSLKNSREDEVLEEE